VLVQSQSTDDKSFGGRTPKFSIHFEEILSHAHGTIEDQNRFLESSIIIIIYLIIFNACYNYVINVKDNYYISNTGLLEKCVKEENVDVTDVATTSCLKRRYRVSQ
jgi:hypothetical protein